VSETKGATILINNMKLLFGQLAYFTTSNKGNGWWYSFRVITLRNRSFSI